MAISITIICLLAIAIVKSGDARDWVSLWLLCGLLVAAVVAAGFVGAMQ